MRVGIIGVSGYTGFELIKILLNHPKFEISYLAANSKAKIDEIFPKLKGIFDFDIEVADAKIASQKCDLVFLALPNGESMKFAKILRQNDVKIVDLSADYRISKQNYEKFYSSHIDEDGLKEAVYGLVEINREKIKKANLIANPGCYPTASLLAILPFAKFIDTNYGVIIDAKSGVSGAGKSLKQTSHFVNVNENINAYNPIIHRHTPEISEKISNHCGKEINLTFVPQLIPITRGMLVNSYIKLNKNIDPLEILENFYKDEKFIRIRKNPVSVQDVINTHFCDIYAQKNGDILFINSAIDNLLKGASSQAIANANLICGFDENLGIFSV